MACVSSLIGVNAGLEAGCYASGNISTKEYSTYAGMVSGWVTGIGKSYNCLYDLDTAMTIGSQKVNPVESIGTKVASGVNEDGDAYTGGLVDGNTGVKADAVKSSADLLNSFFAAYPANISDYGITAASLRQWTADEEAGSLLPSGEYVTAVYSQPACELVPETEEVLPDGDWYGRSSDKTAVVKITVKDGQTVEKTLVSGSAQEGSQAYEEACEKAVYKAGYGDISDYAAADPSVFAGGQGTEESPYLISDEAQLRYLASSINEDTDWAGVYFRQTGNIDISSGEWLPIGRAINGDVNGKKTLIAAYPFRGNYDGGNYSITGLTIGSEDKASDLMTAGLFGMTDGQLTTNALPEEGQQTVTLENIRLYDIYINQSTRYETYTGGLLGNGQNGIYIDNCLAEGKIICQTVESFARAGGIAGNVLRGAITNCGADVDVTASTDSSNVYAGGAFALTNRVTVVNCYAKGNVSADSTNNNKTHAGGFTAQAGGVQINCYASGDVISLKTTTDVGGLNGRTAGIAADYNCYCSSDAKQQNGDTVNETNVGAGVVVGSQDAEDITLKTASQLASAEFAAELDENASESSMEEVMNSAEGYLNGDVADSGFVHRNYYDGRALLAWNAAEGGAELAFVKMSGTSGGNDASGGGSSSGSTGGSGGNSASSGGSGSSTDTSVITEPETPLAQTPSFTDVAQDAYYKDAVDWAVKKGITSGIADSLFGPDASCTRAQAVTFLWRAAGSPAAESENPFNDVKASAYYKDAVLWAVSENITKGISASAFGPDEDCTRAQIVTFLYRWAEGAE